MCFVINSLIDINSMNDYKSETWTVTETNAEWLGVNKVLCLRSTAGVPHEQKAEQLGLL